MACWDQVSRLQAQAWMKQGAGDGKRESRREEAPPPSGTHTRLAPPQLAALLATLAAHVRAFSVTAAAWARDVSQGGRPAVCAPWGAVAAGGAAVAAVVAFALQKVFFTPVAQNRVLPPASMSENIAPRRFANMFSHRSRRAANGGGAECAPPDARAARPDIEPAPATPAPPTPAPPTLSASDESMAAPVSTSRTNGRTPSRAADRAAAASSSRDPSLTAALAERDARLTQLAAARLAQEERARDAERGAARARADAAAARAAATRETARARSAEASERAARDALAAAAARVAAASAQVEALQARVAELMPRLSVPWTQAANEGALWGARTGLALAAANVLVACPPLAAVAMVVGAAAVNTKNRRR